MPPEPVLDQTLNLICRSSLRKRNKPTELNTTISKIIQDISTLWMWTLYLNLTFLLSQRDWLMYKVICILFLLRDKCSAKVGLWNDWLVKDVSLIYSAWWLVIVGVPGDIWSYVFLVIVGIWRQWVIFGILLQWAIVGIVFDDNGWYLVFDDSGW